jgi:transposase-like protein
MPDKQQRNRRQFTPEFKRDAVELVRTSGCPIGKIARERGIYDSTPGNWIKQDRIDRGALVAGQLSGCALAAVDPVALDPAA